MSEENDTLPSMETYTSAGAKDMSILQLQLELIGRQRSIMLRKRAHLQEKVRRELMSTVRQIRLELVEGRLGLDRDLDLAALAYQDLDEVEWDLVDQEWNVLGLEPDLFSQDMSGILPQNQERPISVLPTLTCVDRPSSWYHLEDNDDDSHSWGGNHLIGTELTCRGPGSSCTAMHVRRIATRKRSWKIFGSPAADIGTCSVWGSLS